MKKEQNAGGADSTSPFAGWVDVDVSPENRTMVIANCTPIYGTPYVTGCWFERGEFYDQGKTVRVSHWMAMPEPPNANLSGGD
jgi:hypothetical protein